MERKARSPNETPSNEPDRAMATAWHAPAGWPWPTWLEPEPEPAGLPMSKDRMRWCLHALGWSLEELARRVHTHESSIRQMARGRRSIPDPLALWLEAKVALLLGSPLEPDGWRPKAANR